MPAIAHVDVPMVQGLGAQIQPFQIERSGDSASLKSQTLDQTNAGIAVVLVEKLGTEDYSFQIKGLDLLKEQDRDGYGVILLATWCSQKKIMGSNAASFLEEDPQSSKVIVLYTHGGADPYPDTNKLDIHVDAVSSASTKDRVETVAEVLAALIEARF